MCKYTILVNSCDAYEDLWGPFFILLQKYWPEAKNKKILLNSERKSFSVDGLNIQKAVLSDYDCETWSRRFKSCLEQIDTKYVIVLLDDFFLEKEVDDFRLNQCLEAMEQDETIKNFSFVPTLWKSVKDRSFLYFERRRKGPYLLNLQAGLWRTEELKSLVVEDESPWEFEELGTYRAAKAGGKYYVAADNCPQVFTYNWKPGGAVHRGKWTDGVEEILRAVDVDIDFNIRGWDRDVPVAPQVRQRKTLRKRLSDLVWPFVEWYKYYR